LTIPARALKVRITSWLAGISEGMVTTTVCPLEETPAANSWKVPLSTITVLLGMEAGTVVPAGKITVMVSVPPASIPELLRMKSRLYSAVSEITLEST
jgi:hypothetical protein